MAVGYLNSMFIVPTVSTIREPRPARDLLAQPQSKLIGTKLAYRAPDNYTAEFLCSHRRHPCLARSLCVAANLCINVFCSTIGFQSLSSYPFPKANPLEQRKTNDYFHLQAT